ncbi:MAG: CpsD/CapB family tyrosine-protein kinase [Candidatus Acidiferrales bacterium]
MSRNFDIPHRPEESVPPFASVGSPASPALNPVRPMAFRGRAPAHEEVVKLVQRIFILPGSPAAPRIVVFSGIEPGDGCSWVCAHAAQELSEQAAGAVCIVDANLRSPSLHKRFRLENAPNLASSSGALRPTAEFTRRLPGRNLSLIAAGSAGLDVANTLNPPRLNSFMAELRREFDYILVDTPALSVYNDAVLLGQVTDGIVLVVGSNSTRRETARIAKESLEAANVRVLGAVLNKRTFPIPEPLYRRL